MLIVVDFAVTFVVVFVVFVSTALAVNCVMFENVNFENSYFSDCLFHDITINNCKGLKNAFFENINFGTIETPIILSDEKALQYLLNYNI